MKKTDMPEKAFGYKMHWEKDLGDSETANLKYSDGQFSNPRELKESEDRLAQYVRKNKMKY